MLKAPENAGGGLVCLAKCGTLLGGRGAGFQCPNWSTMLHPAGVVGDLLLADSWEAPFCCDRAVLPASLGVLSSPPCLGSAQPHAGEEGFSFCSCPLHKAVEGKCNIKRERGCVSTCMCSTVAAQGNFSPSITNITRDSSAACGDLLVN